ncbi:MAG: hypothetical protein WBQ63_08590 [Candidatus Acidiferrales bacterium]
MFREALLPDALPEIEFFLRTKGKPAFNVLQAFLQGDIGRRRQQKMEMVRHDYKFMQKKSLLPAILLQDLQQQRRHSRRLQNWTMARRDRRHEECPNFLRSERRGDPGG